VGFGKNYYFCKNVILEYETEELKDKQFPLF